ncbi:MAG: hypothetical protein IT463_01255, partial [Planctomycetes bacterium]|nr:hypothetical protein [Planctomycetota bacterium]
ALTAGTPEGEPEQHYADLLEAVRISGQQWDKNDGTHPDPAKWKQFMADLDAALVALKDTNTGPAGEAKFAAVGKA